MDFSHLTIEKISDPGIIKQFEQKTAELVFYDDQPAAYELLLALQQRLGELNVVNASPGVYGYYQGILFSLWYLSFAFLSEEESLGFMEVNLLDLLKNKTFSLEERIGIRSETYLDSEINGYFEKITKILRKNQLKIGNKTISNWIINYDSTAGGKAHSSVERTEYMIKNKDVQMLNEQDKGVLRKLLTLYDELKIPPIEITGA